MKYFKKIKIISDNDLASELAEMLNANKIKWHRHGQICLNSVKGHEDDYTLGNGSLYYNWKDLDVKKSNNLLTLPIRDIIYEEDDFTVLCNVFKGTQFEDIYMQLQHNFKIGRVRLMKSTPKTCLTWHNDTSCRLHYPLKTQTGCFMIIQDEIMHIPKNEWWLTDTTVKHTALNSSKEERIHLVVSILDEYENY